MFSAMLLAISAVALVQFGVYYWRALVVSEAAQPVSQQVLDAASADASTLCGEDYRTLAQLHELTPDLCFRHSGLGLVPAYFKFIHVIGTLAAGRISALAAWAEGERAMCARYVAVQVERRLQSNLALAASIRSC
jgi:hypothetical protein